jgi:MazG family protein
MPDRRKTNTKSASAAGAAFQRLVDIMAHLRGPKGCPWDREQTLESLRGFVLEETHEVLHAIDTGDRAALGGEIGDLMFEGVFLAQICADAGDFTVTDSLNAISEKLIRRHPHVFDPKGRPLSTAGQVVQQWEDIKAKEQTDSGTRKSLLAGVPATLPSLLRAHEIGTRAAAVGFDWTQASDVVDKIEEEVRELRGAVDHEGAKRTEEELGDLLFAIANLARKLGIEPESALRMANDKFTKRFGALEERVESQGRVMREMTLEELEREWAAVKSDEHGESTKPTKDTKTTKGNRVKKAAKGRSSSNRLATATRRS